MKSDKLNLNAMPDEQVHYENIPVEDVVEMAGNDRNAMDWLLNKYKQLVKCIAQRYYIRGGDRDDVMQEGMIGLYSAIIDFNKDSNVKFTTFAGTCIKNKIKTAITRSNTNGNRLLSEAGSLYEPINDESGDDTSERIDTISDPNATDPQTELDAHELENDIRTFLNEQLSDIERNVAKRLETGMSYNEIALDMNITEKAVDNAIQRMRKKFRKSGITGANVTRITPQQVGYIRDNNHNSKK